MFICNLCHKALWRYRWSMIWEDKHCRRRLWKFFYQFSLTVFLQTNILNIKLEVKLCKEMRGENDGTSAENKEKSAGEKKKVPVTGWEKIKKRQMVSDVIYVLTTVHNCPVASINMLYAKCSLLKSSVNAQHKTLTLTQGPSSFTLRTQRQLRQIRY